AAPRGADVAPYSRTQQRVRDAEAIAARTKQDALDADADVRSGATFGQGLRKERDAASFRRSGRDEAAAQAFVAAADRFRKAASEARLIAEEEAQERLKKQAGAHAQSTPPTAPRAGEMAAANALQVQKGARLHTIRGH